MEYNRLYRSNTTKVIGGVAGGLAEHFGTDPALIRILFVLAAVFGGGGLFQGDGKRKMQEVSLDSECNSDFS